MSAPKEQGTRVPLAARRTAVYRFYDPEGQLLYVGIADDVMARWRWHSKHSPWWPLAAHADVVWRNNRQSAEVEETQAIRSERAVWNVAKTGVTPKRNVRIGDTWTQGEALAKQLGVSR